MFAHLRIIRNEEDSRKEMEAIGVEEGGIKIMVPKSFHYCIKFYGLEPQDAIIMKQEMLAAGGDVAISQYAIPPHGKKTDALVIGTKTQLRILSMKMKMQYERLNEAGEKISGLIEGMKKTHEIVIGKTLRTGERTLIMGILNVTPDSFYEGGKYSSVESALERAREMVEEGADIIDVGGESSRPGSLPVSKDEELSRILPVIKAISDELDVPISVDTYRAEVAEEAIKAGAGMVNDITAMGGDENMAGIVSEHGVPICLMHMKGTPQNMQKNPHYDDTMAEITKFLHERAEYAMAKGIDEKNIILDPGIGFGKRTGEGIEDNCEIIARLAELKSLGFPVLVGASRKTFIGNLSNTRVEERLEGSLGAEAMAIANGADILRVHDVKETKRMAMVVDRIVR
ncbi:MAG: dihydropteroate synthase [Thermoplasmata archaeon]|nr:MAG: dihydropteroate synthase [Thermoplasmata archaeon]